MKLYANIHLLGLTLLVLLSFACSKGQSQSQAKSPVEEPFPIVGPRELGPNGDTLYYTIDPFSFWDQDSNKVTKETVEGKFYVTDFFFTTCRTICPKMSQQMLRLHDEFIDEPAVVLLSHSIDPEYDTVGVLKEYATALGVQTDKWHLLTGDKDSLYAMATNYMVSALEDASAPDGFMHSGAFMLIDPQGRIRGYVDREGRFQVAYDGTQADQIDLLAENLRQLLKEYEP